MATKVAKGGKTKTKQLAGMDLPFFIIIMILMTFGLVMMFSASYAWGLYEAGDSFLYIRKQLILASIGVAGMLVISMIDYRIYMKKFIVFGLFITSLAMLIYVGFFGPVIKGARRWIVFGPINFQPSEVMKLAIILLFSYIISVNYTKLNKFSYGIVPFMAVLGTVAGLMMVQPHLS
ncbi:MAG: FtsW/RodA/SpoVE family cell cycle protein, partial [Clostridiales bacterium]|nr:FtsW/RodA/SpoVE family cell cycle protein [Clostridiales bacterium]